MTKPTLLILLILIVAVAGMGQKPASSAADTRCDFSEYAPIKMEHFPKESIISSVSPAYPREARKRRIQDTVYVKLLINEEGIVEKACAFRGNKIFWPEAEESALKWRFKPGNGLAFSALRHDNRKPYAYALIAFNFGSSKGERAGIDVTKVATPGTTEKPNILTDLPLGPLNTSVQTSKNNGPSSLPVINGAASEFPVPAYPEAAKAVCAAGLVEIKVATDENGKVISSEPIGGSRLLIEPALAAAGKAKFRVREGIRVVGKLVYNFDAVMTKACESRFPVIPLGPVNKLAEILPMPRLAKASDLNGGHDIQVRVKIDLQKGEVLDAEIASGGHPPENAAVLKAARSAKFKPSLLEFPPVYGSGLLTYSLNDFNKPNRVNKKPRPFLITAAGKLNSKALVPFPKPEGFRLGASYIAGSVEIAVLIDPTNGKVLTSKAILGPEKLRPVSEKAAINVKFSPSRENRPTPFYITGTIVYRFNKNGRVD